MKRLALIACLALTAPASAPLFAQAARAQASGQRAPDVRAPSEIVAGAPASDWVTIAPSDLLVMDLAPRKDRPSTSTGRRVVIQLIAAPFSQGWVGNIRKLAAARWWDGTSVNRVQDNYVVQWGDASEKKPLPGNLTKRLESEYTVRSLHSWEVLDPKTGNPSGEFVANTFHGADHGSQAIASSRTRHAPSGWHQTDAYAAWVAFDGGWPVAGNEFQDDPREAWWPVHCYGMVGVGRNLSPDTGSGAELYTVIGHAPRHLDRNIALVGRVIEGIEHLSSLPRGTGALGFYERAEEREPIVSVRLGNAVRGLPAYQYLSTESESFARYADARANRRDPFFNVPAGGADICNIPVPVRRRP